MAGQIAVGGFVALGVLIAVLPRFPRFASPGVGLSLLGLSGAVSIAALVHVG